jgi:hypothetical protein
LRHCYKFFEARVSTSRRISYRPHLEKRPNGASDRRAVGLQREEWDLRVRLTRAAPGGGHALLPLVIGARDLADRCDLAANSAVRAQQTASVSSRTTGLGRTTQTLARIAACARRRGSDVAGRLVSRCRCSVRQCREPDRPEAPGFLHRGRVLRQARPGRIRRRPARPRPAAMHGPRR